MTTVCTLLHPSLVPNTSCPFCHHSNEPYESPSGVTDTLGLPNQSQYTLWHPVPLLPSIKPLTLATLTCCKGGGSTSYSYSGYSSALSVTRFHVRVVHASYS